MTDLELAYQTLKKALENDEYRKAWAQSIWLPLLIGAVGAAIIILTR